MVRMRPVCGLCGGRGARRVNYRSGEPCDFGLCSCAAGLVLRREIDADPDGLENRFGVPLDRIWPIETLMDDEPQVVRTDMDILLSAGKVDRAGLSGKVRRS